MLAASRCAAKSASATANCNAWSAVGGLGLTWSPKPDNPSNSVMTSMMPKDMGSPGARAQGEHPLKVRHVQPRAHRDALDARPLVDTPREGFSIGHPAGLLPHFAAQKKGMSRLVPEPRGARMAPVSTLRTQRF